MKIILFLIRLIVGAIGINTWIFGCCMMFYVVWSLNTINNIQSFSFGNALITNSQLIFGLLLSTVGLLIIYSSWKKNCHTLKLCIFLTVLIISMEIGTFISAKVANIQISNLVDQGWKEINIQSRNFIQKELKCCGLTGLSEFASKLDPIDQSCYREQQSLSTSTSSIEYDNHPITIYEPYRIGCKQKLIDWLRKQRKTFIISICSLLAVQILSIILMLILLKLLQNDLFKQQQRRRLQSNNMIIIGGSCVGDDESPTSSTSPSSLIFNNGKNKQILLDDI